MCLALVAGLAPRPASAQMSIYDALARRFSDVSFFANTGKLAPLAGAVRGDRTTSYGIEVLLEIGGVRRPAPASALPRDSAVAVWTGRQITRDGTRADTVDTYEVRPGGVRAAGDPLWTFELGIGYGQLTGFELEDRTLDMRGAGAPFAEPLCIVRAARRVCRAPLRDREAAGPPGHGRGGEAVRRRR